MIVNNVCLVSNNDPTYYRWWNKVSKVWKVNIGIDPILLFINDTGRPVNFDETYGKVVEIDYNPNLKIIEQTTMMRLWYVYNTDDTVLSTDIDLLPLSKKHYNDCLADINDDLFVWLNSPTYSQTNLRHMFSSNVCKGSTLRNIIDSKVGHSNNIVEFISKLASFTQSNIKNSPNPDNDHLISRGRRRNIGLDELCLKYLLKDYDENKVININPAGINKEYYLEQKDWFYKYRYHEIFKTPRYTDVENKLRNGEFADYLPNRHNDDTELDRIIELAFGNQ